MYTPCKTNVPYYTPGKANFSELYIRQVKSDLYTLQDKLFRIIHPGRQIFRFKHLVRQTFQIDTPHRKSNFQIYTHCKSNFSDLCTLQDICSRYIHPAGQAFFRFIHPAGQTFQINTPCKTNLSDLYQPQAKLFKFMHPAR